MSKNEYDYRKAFYAKLPGEAIMFHPKLQRLLGDTTVAANAALIFNQFLLYAKARGIDAWQWMTLGTMEDQTGLKRGAQDRAIALLVAKGFLEEKLMKQREIPEIAHPVRHFKINYSVAIKAADQMFKTNNDYSSKRSIHNARYDQQKDQGKIARKRTGFNNPLLDGQYEQLLKGKQIS